MNKVITSSLIFSSMLLADAALVESGGSVVPHDQDYFTKDIRNTQLIFTQKNIKDAGHVAAIETHLQGAYEKSFGYTMDDRLYVGLISDYNQIANGFSTQFPINRQINYIGGTQLIDYFSSTSWIDTLIYHETAHNYQTNVKDSAVSSALHTVFKNGAFFIPWFSVPNIVSSSFLLEGNAVLNESWHGNGGRLYSGRFRNITLQQAKAGNLTPARQYTANLEFLYGEKNYITGSYFQYYLAKTYGLDKANSYWKNQSQDWEWPFYVNNSMERTIGIDFEKAMSNWNDLLKDDVQNMTNATGKTVAHSQFFTSLNSDKDEIYFLTNESGRRAPEVVRLDKQRQSLKIQRESFPPGKLIKYKDELYVQSSRNANPWRIYQGLLDSSAHFLENSKGKMIQGYLSSGQEVYFDVSRSYNQAQLYIGDNFYAIVNSSVIIDSEDNLYYFVQKDKRRTLYKNQTPLYSYEGFYGLVSDVDSKGNVYFIANSKYGSSLYMFDGEKTHRVSKADNIIEARLINDEEVLLAAVSDSEYYYLTTKLEEIKETPFVVHLFMEDQAYYKDAVQAQKNRPYIGLDMDEPYYSVLDMHYSGTDLVMGYSPEGVLYDVSFKFADPLNQNSFYLYAQRDLNAVTTAGIHYKNSQYFIRYDLSTYAVLDKNNALETRDFGLIAAAELPIYKSGYWNAYLQSAYYQDYLSNTRAPLSGILEVSRAEQFGVSLRPNSLYYAKVYGALERSDIIAGGYLKYAHDLPAEIYVSLDAQYSITNAPSSGALQDRGVQLSRSASVFDPSAITMPALLYTDYLKEGFVSHAKIEKVFNASLYYFTFPISLQRESFYFGYNIYDIKTLIDRETSIFSESVYGAMFQLAVMNQFVVPLSIEYINNRNFTIAQENFLNIQIGLSF